MDLHAGSPIEQNCSTSSGEDGFPVSPFFPPNKSLSLESGYQCVSFTSLEVEEEITQCLTSSSGIGTENDENVSTTSNSEKNFNFIDRKPCDSSHPFTSSSSIKESETNVFRLPEPELKRRRKELNISPTDNVVELDKENDKASEILQTNKKPEEIPVLTLSNPIRSNEIIKTIESDYLNLVSPVNSCNIPQDSSTPCSSTSYNLLSSTLNCETGVFNHGRKRKRGRKLGYHSLLEETLAVNSSQQAYNVSEIRLSDHIEGSFFKNEEENNQLLQEPNGLTIDSTTTQEMTPAQNTNLTEEDKKEFNDINSYHEVEEADRFIAIYLSEENMKDEKRRLDQERNLSDATDSLSDLSVYAFSDASINDPFAVERIFYIEEQNLSPSDLLSTTEAASLAQNSLYGNTTETENSSDFERIHFPLHQPHSEVWIRKRIGISNYIMNYIRLDQLCEESLHTRISSYAKLDIALPSQVECQAGYVNDKIKGEEEQEIPSKATVPVLDSNGLLMETLQYKFHPEIFLPFGLRWVTYKTLSNGIEISLIAPSSLCDLLS